MIKTKPHEQTAQSCFEKHAQKRIRTISGKKQLPANFRKNHADSPSSIVTGEFCPKHDRCDPLSFPLFRIRKTAIALQDFRKLQKLPTTFGFEFTFLQCRKGLFLKRPRIAAVHRVILLLYVGDFFGRKSAPPQPDKIQIGDIVPFQYRHKRRNVHGNFRIAGDKRALADVHELMDHGTAAEKNIILNNHTPGNQCQIRQDTAISDHGIMRDMRIRHQQTILSNMRLLTGLRRPMNGHAFAQNRSIADDNAAFEIKFLPTDLRIIPQNNPRMHLNVIPEHGPRLDHDVFPDAHPLPQPNAAFDHAKRTDDAVARYVNGSINQCRRMDHENVPLSTLLLARRRFKGKGIYREWKEL